MIEGQKQLSEKCWVRTAKKSFQTKPHNVICCWNNTNMCNSLRFYCQWLKIVFLKTFVHFMHSLSGIMSEKDDIKMAINLIYCLLQNPCSSKRLTNISQTHFTLINVSSIAWIRVALFNVEFSVSVFRNVSRGRRSTRSTAWVGWGTKTCCCSSEQRREAATPIWSCGSLLPTMTRWNGDPCWGFTVLQYVDRGWTSAGDAGYFRK